jgi:hypothetical protein
MPTAQDQKDQRDECGRCVDTTASAPFPGGCCFRQEVLSLEELVEFVVYDARERIGLGRTEMISIKRSCTHEILSLSVWMYRTFDFISVVVSIKAGI